jgi:benzodiazapine receptor
MKINWLYVFLGIALCEIVGIAGSLAMTNPASYYGSLNKPGYAPPSWVFGPVWVTLYAFMGAALGLVASSPVKKGKLEAYLFFGAQLAVNGVWSFLFFSLQSPFFGLIDIALLWVLIAASMLKFYRLSKAAVVLMIPYLVWVSVAASLNYWVYALN